MVRLFALPHWNALEVLPLLGSVLLPVLEALGRHTAPSLVPPPPAARKRQSVCEHLPQQKHSSKRTARRSSAEVPWSCVCVGVVPVGGVQQAPPEERRLRQGPRSAWAPLAPL